MFGKNKNNSSQYANQNSKIEYVVKFGYNGIVTKRFACKSLADINSFKFDKNCDIIEIYRQATEARMEKETKINENALVFMVRLFKGDYIPTLQAMQLPCEKTSVNKEYKNEYNNLVKQLVPQGASGIISVQGHPYLAQNKNTFYFELNDDGKVDTIYNLDSIFLSAEAKYQAIIEGKPYANVNSQITTRAPIYITQLTDVLKR